VELAAPLKRVCVVLEAPRSTIYARRSKVFAFPCARRGPQSELTDEQVIDLVRHVIRSSPFTGEGYRKVTAHLHRDYDLRIGRKRVLRLMRQAGLLAPQRAKRRRKPRAHDGTIIPEAPDAMWGTDATMAYTRNDGWVWVFCCVEHFTAEGWASVAKRGDRFACLEPIYDAVREHFGEVAPDIARGVAMRHDWGPQYTSGHFQGALAWLGISDSPAFAGEPPCNGCAERFIRTLKEQVIWAKLYDDVEELRAAIAVFIELYNSQWLIERHGHRTPREAYADARKAVAA
jgi:transposase InsO family protein